MTKKNIKILIAIILAVCLVFGIYAFARTHTITLEYNYYAGSLHSFMFPEPPPNTVDYTSTRHNSYYVPPNLTRPGYTFKGWHKDSALTVPWVNGVDKVKSDITLYAKWEKD